MNPSTPPDTEVGDGATAEWGLPEGRAHVARLSTVERRKWCRGALANALNFLASRYALSPLTTSTSAQTGPSGDGFVTHVSQVRETCPIRLEDSAGM